MSNGVGKHDVKTAPATKPAVKTAAPAANPTSPRAEQTQGR